MKTTALLLSCFGLSLLAGTSSDSFPTTHFAELRGVNELPEVETDALGAASFSYNPATRELSYIIGHTVDGVSAAHIHGPANEGETGSVVFDFGDPTSPMTGSFTLDEAQEADLLAGLYYVNIHSQAFPNGEIRGQLRDNRSMSTRLSGDQEVPPVTTNARGFATVLYEASTRELRVYVVHSLLNNVTGAHIHGPALPGESGGVVFPLNVGLVSITGEFTLSESQAADLLSGRYYINIHTNAFPNGELRGQISGRTWFAGVMSGLQEFPPNGQTQAVGAFVAYLDSSTTDELSFLIQHDVVDATAAHIHGPASPGQNAGVLYNLGDPTPPIMGTLMLMPEDIDILLNNQTYINVHSPTFPAGEIRGQINTLANVHAMAAEYFDLVLGWATDTVNECFGQPVDITALIEFINNDLTCPTATP